MEKTVVDVVLGSDIPYITCSVPLFFVLIGIELLVARAQGKRLYSFADSIGDLSCGIVQQMGGLFVRGMTVGGYIWLEQRYGLIDIEALGAGGKWVAAFVLFMGVDLFYYWFHRLSHEVNFLWAAHMVHHQSEEYNLSVALRQSLLQGWFSWVFYLPLALLGFPTSWFLAMLAFNTLYQFWVHTRIVGDIGWLENVINTPSHHRVHHGKNPQYIDRNHAGTLIIWDKIFGTFEPEVEPVVYGTTRELKSWNPLWANLQEWAALAEEARGFSRWQDKVKIWFAEPGWRPADMPPEPPRPQLTPETQVKYATPASAALIAYVLVHFTLALVAGVVVLVFEGPMGLWSLAPVALWVVASLTLFGGLFEAKGWARLLEPVRLLSAVGLVAYYGLGQSWGAVALGAVAVVTVLSLVARGRLARSAAPALQSA